MKALRAVEPLKSGQLRVLTVQQLMTPAQLADYLQVEVTTLYVWVSRRRIPYRKIRLTNKNQSFAWPSLPTFVRQQYPPPDT